VPLGEKPMTKVTRSITGLSLAVGLSLLLTLPAHGQAAGEYAGATSGMASVTVSRSGVFNPSMPATRPTSSTTHLAKPTGPPPEVLNRDWFREQAGKQGIRAHLASTPAGASLWVDGRYVGQTPLELFLPAGHHQVRLLGPHQEYLEATLELRAGGSTQILYRLPPSYPAVVQALTHHEK
jgi:hypothetical protein